MSREKQQQNSCLNLLSFCCPSLVTGKFQQYMVRKAQQQITSIGIQSPCQMMIGVYNHLRNGRYLGSMKPFSEGDWIPNIGNMNEITIHSS